MDIGRAESVRKKEEITYLDCHMEAHQSRTERSQLMGK